MKTTKKLLVTGMLAVFCCSVVNAQISYSNSMAGATLIYSNFFNGSMVNITNTQATYEAGILGGKSNTNWVDALGTNNTNALYASGQMGTAQGDAWLLPFVPQTNYVYTLTASVDFTGSPGTWVGAGFANYFGVIGGTDDRFNTGGVDFGILTESSRNVQAFAGVGAATQFGNSNSIWTPATGTHTLTMILDTTSTKWVIACFVDGTQAGTNYPYPSNPSILGTGLTQNAGVNPTTFTWVSFTLSANPLVITRQPVSATLAAGNTFTNSVAVAATSPSYQWYQNGQPLPRAGQTNIINGATNATLILTNLQPADSSTNYYVVITNSLGSITSAPVTLAVETAPTIATAYPVAYTNPIILYGGTNIGGTNYAGSTPTFSVSAIGQAPLHYQWRTNGVAVSGATNTSFTFTNCPLNGPTTFACVVSNLGGAASNSWTVSYLSTPTAPFPAVVMSYEPAGYWRLDEVPDIGGGDDGVVANDYASGNNGIYTNAILNNGGYSGTDPTETSALFASYASPDSDVFDIQGLDFATPASSSATFSVQAWVKGAGTQATGAGIIAKGYNGGEEFVLDATNNDYRFLVRDAAGNPYSIVSTTGSDNAWHFLAGVCDEVNGAVSFYVDGVIAGSVPIAPGVGLLSSTQPITIGARNSSPVSDNNLQFAGYLNDLAAFNYALTQNQIVAEYSAVGSVLPYFTQTPPASVSANAGSVLTLPAFASGTTPIGYYWTDVNASTNVTAGSSNGVPLNATLTVSNVPGSWNGDQLELTVTNAAGSTNFYVLLTVFTNLAIDNNLPASVSALSGAPYTYSIGVVGPGPYYYQWYHAGSPVLNQTNATYAVTAGVSGSTTYSVVVSNSFTSVTSLVSTLTTVPQISSAYASAVLQLNPAGYWPMHEVETAAAGDTETNYGTLGLLGTAYYSDWVSNYGAFTRQVPGAIAGTDTALHFDFNVGNLGNGAGTWTNEMYVPHTSPLSTLNPPFSVECWLYNTNNSVGQENQSVWGQHGWEGFNSGYAGSDTGASTISGMQLAFSTTAITVYGYFAGVQNPIISASASLNTWVHVVVTCDASTNFTLYVDGTQQSTASGAGKFTPDYWTPLTIGGTRGGTRSAIITVDEFAVYTNVITDISNHYSDASVSDSAYFHDVTNDNPVVYLRMDAPAYNQPGTGSWPELFNYGSVGTPGVYTPGVTPGVAPGPMATNGSNYAGLPGTNVAALSGVSSFADAGYASAYNPTGSNANFSVTATFRGNPCDNRVQAIASHGINSWQLNISTNGTIVFNAGNGSGGASGGGGNPGDFATRGVYNDGKWHQVVAVNESNAVSIYVDGVLDNSGTPSGVTATNVIPGNSSDVMIGADPSFTNNPTGVGRQFAGQVCEVAFLNQALTVSQVTNLYALAVSGSSVNLTPPILDYSLAAGQLTLSWPSDHIGWTLQAQTNNTGIGINTNWVSVPNSTSTNQVVIPTDPAAGSVFYRLYYP